MSDILKSEYMKLIKFINKYHLLNTLSVDHIAIKHPETGDKVYVVSQWGTGIWVRKTKGSADKEGQMWPIQWDNKIGNLEVHKDAKKELGITD